jgi:hypothetical protein
MTFPNVTTPFVTSISSGLPPGRPIACYGYGSPCIASVDLSHYCRGLVTTCVNNWDCVPTLSLGLIQDMRNVAVNLCEGSEGEGGSTAEEIVGRVVGIWQRKVRESKKKDFGIGKRSEEVEQDQSNPTLFDLYEPDQNDLALVAQSSSTVPNHDRGEDLDLQDWLWSLIKTIRASNDNEKLYPAGTIYNLIVEEIFMTEKFRDGGKMKERRKEARKIILRLCEDVEARFSEPVFSKSSE